MSLYAGVIVDLDLEQTDRVYTYRVPQGMEVAVGQRVRAPFGKRQVEGFVVELSDACAMDPARVRPLSAPLEDYPLLLPQMLELARWMSERYLCTLSAALRLMIPAQLRGGRVGVKQVRIAALAVDRQAAQAALKQRARFPRQVKVLQALMQGPLPVPVLEGDVPGAGAVLRALEKKGLVRVNSQESLRSPFKGPVTRASSDPKLTPQQQAAADQVARAMAQGGGSFLLMGVTGSGKTEVYIRLIRLALKAGKGAIVLVPEIALTPQMVDWFRARFGQGAAVLHSQLSPGERFDEWRRIRRGQARVVVGARSAVFAPVEDLGLIVVDEEHEHTYQSDKRPRYDAREVAQFRCRQEGAALVLGSATPSIATFMRTMPKVRPQNKLELLELTQRVFQRPLPQVEVVDMCRELERGNHSMFSAPLRDGLKQCLERGQQAMLLINRRGYSTFVSCRSCGYVEKCGNCDVSMTYHQAEGVLKCHYCGQTRRPPDKCPQCGSIFIKYFGAGTQRVEEAVKKLLPQARVARMDVDTTRGKDAHQRILSAFGRGETDVLIGTQMIAKGLDFPKVTLVGVVAADMTLNLPDYRAPERTFQLITQVAGRAGRAQYPGRVVIQTYEPQHYAVRLAARQDYRAFYQEEVKVRRRGLYPPFTLMARLLVTAKEAGQARSLAMVLEEALGRFLDQRPERRRLTVQMRALEAPIGRLRGESRWQVFIKLYAKAEAEEILEEMDRLCREQEEREARVELEVNPANMF